MKRVLMLVIGVLLSAAVQAQDKPKLAEMQVYINPNDGGGHDWIEVDGYWEPDNPTKQNELVPAATHIECYRHGGMFMVGTEAWCVTATALATNLDISLEFSGGSWSEDEIVISDSHPICIVTKTIFDLHGKTVTGLDIRKPEAKGFADSCKLLPDRQTYYLRDRVDYRLHRVPAK